MRRSIARSVAAPWCALAILLAACTDSGAATEDDQPIEQPAPKPETPAEPDTPDVSDDPNNPDDPDVPDNPNNPENPNNPDNPDNPDNPGEDAPQYEDVKAVLQEILGDSYDTMAGEVSQHITLTAQTIDAATDMFPVLKSVVADSSKMNDAKTKVNESTDAVKKALVAQAEGKISLTKKELKEEDEVLQGVFEKEDKNQEGGLIPVWGSNLYYISAEDKDFKISLSGDFDYFNNHIESLEGDIDISNLNIISHELGGDRILVPTSSLKEEIYEKFNLESKNAESLPTLSFGLYNDYGLKHFLAIYNKYDKSEKLNIYAHFGSMDGRTLVDGVDKNDYTLFESDGNTAKESTSPSIKSFEINELIDFAEKYHISRFYNLIISGDAKTAEVDWGFTNIIFEGDMSKLTNTSTKDLSGIVYFKKLPYNNENVNYGNGQSINGAVRLDELSSNIKLRLNAESKYRNSVVDIRGIDMDKMNAYNPSNEEKIFRDMASVYFNADVKDLTKDFALYNKFIIPTLGGFISNEYFGASNRQDSRCSEKEDPASKTPRKLSEFEYYGNNGHYENAAIDSYNNDFSSVTQKQEDALRNDIETKQIAKVSTLCPLC